MWCHLSQDWNLHQCQLFIHHHVSQAITTRLARRWCGSRKLLVLQKGLLSSHAHEVERGHFKRFSEDTRN
jgi:hypothetical protein